MLGAVSTIGGSCRPGTTFATIRGPWGVNGCVRCRPGAAPRLVRAAAGQDQQTKIKESLKQSGMDKAAAQKVIKQWREEVGHEVTPDQLRKVLVKQSTKALGFVVFSTVLDAASAYVAFSAGSYLSTATEQYGLLGAIFSTGAFLVAGWYAAGVVSDVFKLGVVVAATVQFNVNSAAFLAAVEDIAGGSGGTGLGAADKALEAANSVKVLQALGKMADILQSQSGTSTSGATSGDMLSDLGAYLTLDRAQRLRGFDAAALGLTDAQATEIATLFARYDTNDDGVLSPDEFKRLCAGVAPELFGSDEEIRAAVEVIDTNRDGSIDLTEFASFWQNKIMS